MRRRLLEDLYDKMSEEEKRLFVEMSLQDKSHSEIMQALQQQSTELQAIKKSQQTFFADFGSNLLANATWDSVLWLGTKLLKRL